MGSRHLQSGLGTEKHDEAKRNSVKDSCERCQRLDRRCVRFLLTYQPEAPLPVERGRDDVAIRDRGDVDCDRQRRQRRRLMDPWQTMDALPASNAKPQIALRNPRWSMKKI